MHEFHCNRVYKAVTSVQSNVSIFEHNKLKLGIWPNLIYGLSFEPVMFSHEIKIKDYI